MIVYISIHRIGSLLTTTDSYGGLRDAVPERPGHHVEAVDGYFDDEITGQPVVVIPVSQLIFHVCPTGLAWERPQFTTIPISGYRANIPHGSVEDPTKRFLI